MLQIQFFVLIFILHLRVALRIDRVDYRVRVDNTQWCFHSYLSHFLIFHCSNSYDFVF